ncbi:MAG TPA: peptidylprolyl isomerase [Candidatus Acidoferrum sp.]|jgi:peptidyl-prolyl cis-trans isomerase A (cyclophilin A)|nr:peptidylprolyl isomerase [Candidatus Acidoferrum sp.]
MHLKTCAQLLAALILAIPAVAQTPATTAKPKSTTTAAKPATPSSDRALLKPALLKDQAPETYQVKFDTTRGEFTITVTRAWSPLGADRFYNLVKHHYFDNARFFRVLPNFVVQFGLSANPAVNAAWEKATIKDDPRSHSNTRGTLVFATAGPNTRTTQLFINLKDNGSNLDSQGFTPFGQVDGDGMKVVEMLYDQYGESAGMDQENISKGGEKFIATHWPKLDTIKSGTLVGTAATAPSKPAPKPATAAKPAAKPATTTPKPQ